MSDFKVVQREANHSISIFYQKFSMKRLITAAHQRRAEIVKFQKYAFRKSLRTKQTGTKVISKRINVKLIILSHV